MNVFSQLSQAIKGALQWWVVLAPWEQALRVRRGRNVKYLKGGIHLRIPLLDRFFVQSVRLRITDLPIQTVTTRDGHTITLKGQLGYRIVDLERLYDTLHDAEGTVVNMAQQGIADHVTGQDLNRCHPGQVVDACQAVLETELADYGLGDVRLSITDYARVKTYRLITQDIWAASGLNLDTSTHHSVME